MGFFEDERGNRSMGRLQSFVMVMGGTVMALAATAWAIAADKADIALLGAVFAQASSMMFQGFMAKNRAKEIERETA